MSKMLLSREKTDCDVPRKKRISHLYVISINYLGHKDSFGLEKVATLFRYRGGHCLKTKYVYRDEEKKKKLSPPQLLPHQLGRDKLIDRATCPPPSSFWKTKASCAAARFRYNSYSSSRRRKRSFPLKNKRSAAINRALHFPEL